MTTWADLRAMMMANKHEHALRAVGNVRFLMLEGQLARAVAARKDAERRFHEYVCSENDELNRLRAENRRLQTENAALTRVLLSDRPANRPGEPVGGKVLSVPSPRTPGSKCPPAASPGRLNSVANRPQGKLKTLSPAAQPRPLGWKENP